MISFCESYVRLRQAGYDEATARQLALGDQAPALEELWREDDSGADPAAPKDHLARLQRMKQSGRGQRFRTKSGVRVRSKAEKIIADFLFDQGLDMTRATCLKLIEPKSRRSSFVKEDNFCLTKAKIRGA